MSPDIRPLGDEGFVKKVGGLLGRNLLPGKPGRPRENSIVSLDMRGPRADGGKAVVLLSLWERSARRAG